ncbi:WXG100 family type VII secretion target [Bacillus dicomae]|uniref:WXG100 family type VII secretion target n=1 Tax=Bacillus dicomae TaxID=3088378 RepID=A0AC61T508_9BACI|nr:WXG100 family type VII secretion target [Bacillus dicomae]TPV43788.1 WXG100 family type VII secretion target [Bacillus dicomae]
MVQIKVTPKRLEQVAKTVKNVQYTLEQIHNGLYNQTEHIAANWAGATSQHFRFNEAKPKMFTVLTEFDKIADELERAAEKSRTADAEYDDNLVEGEIIANAPSSKKDGESLEKVTRDLVGELSGEYDVRRVIGGVDPDTGEKLSWWEHTGAGVMVFAGLTPLGKGIKVVKGAKKVADAVNNIDKVKEAKALLKAKRQKQIEINKKVGDDFEREMLQTFKNEGSTEKVYTKQVTLQTPSGVRTRVDIASKNLETSEVHLTELKSSLTAPLTKNQKLAFPEIEKHGAIIKSRNKPPFDYLEVIPPTKVKVIRKE